jgi:protein-S-isoprenylcysteine O-methyltransferase Ste14
MKSKFLVFMQFFVIFLMILPLSEPTSNFYLAMGVSLFGAFIGLLALMKNRFGNFNITPDIREDCTLITTGIYAFVRHPMYISVLLMMSGVVLLYPMMYEFVLYGVLCVTLLTKMFYEEHLWHCESEEYKEYARSTKRLIPYIF